MPNWCSNGVSIKHKDPTKIKALADAMIAGKFLDHVIPVPECLKNPGGSTWGGPESGLYDSIRAENRSQTGFASWYDFCTTRWGTKWDVDCEGVDVSDDGTTVTCSFESAWAPPMGVYEMLVDGGFEVTAYYYEPGMAFVGKFEDGVDDCYEYSGYTSKTVRAAIGEELDDYFCISENMAEWEEDEMEEVQEWYEDGVGKLEAKEAKE